MGNLTNYKAEFKTLQTNEELATWKASRGIISFLDDYWIERFANMDIKELLTGLALDTYSKEEHDVEGLTWFECNLEYRVSCLLELHNRDDYLKDCILDLEIKTWL